MPATIRADREAGTGLFTGGTLVGGMVAVGLGSMSVTVAVRVGRVGLGAGGVAVIVAG